MIKIVAINDPSKDEEHPEDETITQVTKEAQETIAVSEYMRALSLKQNGKPEFALSLFEDLLRTQVLSDVPDEDKDNKLFSVKYNCHRNIGLIYEDRGEYRLALKSLVQAVELDDSDVFTQCKIGRLSLKLNNLLLAKIAFEKCLERNPNHSGAKDGLLQTLCKMEDIDQAYGFALKCYEQDRRYERAIKVLKEIRERFKMSLEYYDGIYGRKPEFDSNCKIKYDPENSVFPDRVEIGFTKENYAVLTEDFKIPDNNLNWITFGKLILRVYHHLEDGNYNLCSWYKWEEWVGSAPEFKVPEVVDIVMETEENKEKKEEIVKTEDPEPAEIGEKSPDESENGESDEKKNSRRRCSDLDFLKEWGWHKNRRSSRKKQKEEEETVDTTINGFLRRILPSYFHEEFQRRSPFAPAYVEVKSLDDSENLDHSKADAEDEEKFFEHTKDSFRDFMVTFREREFDIVIPMFQWLRFISLTWNQTILPGEILILFKKIYQIYEDFVDYHSMHQLPDDDFKATFRMAMLYFELKFDEFEETKAEIPDEFMRKKDFLQMNIGFIEHDLDCTRMLTRLIWLSYCMQIHNNNYKDALGYLYKLEEVYEVPKYSEIAVELRNCKHNKQIDGRTVKELIVKIERKINLASVKNLYETQNYPELIEILRDSIIYSTEPKVNIDNLTLKIQTQIEVFLECLWSLDRIEECLDFAEKSLCYAVDNFLTAPTEYRLDEWAALVNYCLCYIDTATKEPDGSEILFTLGQNLPRLVQSLVKIITNQLDIPVEKNNPGKCHLVNLNTPWTILFHLVLKENDLANSKKKPVDEEEFESLPNSLLIFFTAHEFLGRKQWCMKDNGKLLIFLLDTLSPIYRTPLLEPFRDVIVENLEQTTYCLYGYPVKKAKLRHIEDHDAKNIDLSWERAIQLFDFFRPDTLPEFDSFKLQSITNETEQLFQKIIPLIPKCLDIAPFTGEIKKFINGASTALPKETNILPAKIASIYYLLADFYFKNQETGKAIKYYINDLTMKPDRFDSWASLSLCKESKLEMKLNGNASVGVKEFLEMADQTINCFNQCLKIRKTITILTEFASFTYHLHSFCSRNLKQSSETLSMENFSAIEDRTDKFLNISFKCFSEVCEAVSDTSHELNNSKNQEATEEVHDEKWYYHFMLGKIAEKKKEAPVMFLNHYRESMKFLYEDNATYPIRINHSNPSHLAIESLEVFYRISACIMKYLEQHSKINKPTAKLFLRVLKEMSSSPFAYNRAKINKGNINAMKHKLNASATESTAAKQPKIEAEIEKTDISDPPQPEPVIQPLESSAAIAEPSIEVLPPSVQISPQKMETSTPLVPNSPPPVINSPPPVINSPPPIEPPIQPVIKNIIADSTSRRVSQESVITTTTTTSTRTSSSSDSSADSSSDSDSSSSDETDGAEKENVFVSQEVIENIYKMCIKNLEECVTRFPEHYKSIYRLVHHFLNTGDSLEKCKQLLLSSNYKTALGNSLGGLFNERKNNNFFNGIWRIPSSEIDRPGNFTTHLSKCVIILMDVLKKTNDYETLMDLALQLQRNNESADKKYLNDVDKKELFQQAVTCCVQAFKNKLREILTSDSDEKNRELLTLMLDIFKSHRKTSKIFQQKDQSLFSVVLVEVYKEYIKDKMILPDNANLTDLAFKMCQTEINYRKNLEKGIVTPNPNPPMPQLMEISPSTFSRKTQPVAPSSTTSSPILIKTVSEINKSVTASNEKSAITPTKSAPVSSLSSGSSARTKPRSKQNTNSLLNQNASLNSLIATMYSNPAMFNSLMTQSPESTYMNEYFKSLCGGSSTSAGTSSAAATTAATSAALASLTPQQQLALMADPMSSIISSLYSSPSPTKSPKATSSYEKKYLESLKSIAYGSSNPLVGLQQNLLSNSLSITTTSMTGSTSTSSKASASKSLPILTKKSSQSSKIPQVSITKSDANKYKLPDLPKSLSITPSVPQAVAKVNRISDKGKVQKPKMNYGRSSLSITSDDARIIGMQGSYQDFLKNYIPGQAPTTSVSKPKPSLILPTGGSSSTLLKPQKHKSSSQLPQSSSQAKKSQQTPRMTYESYKALPMSSPTLSISPYSHSSPSLSPSISAGNVVSPQKTLQQKLAERKQQNQQPKKKQDDDVIVLDD